MNTLSAMKHRVLSVVALAVIGAVVAVIVAQFSPVTYKTSISFGINRINIKETGDYQYDGYYAIQASDLFAKTVVSWFLTPSVLLEMYDRAGIDPDISSLDQFTGRFKTRQYSAQNVVVTFNERTQEVADTISGAIIAVVEERAAAANQTAESAPLFEVRGSSPVIVDQRPNAPFSAAAGAAAGIVVGFIVIEFVRSRPTDPRDADRR